MTDTIYLMGADGNVEPLHGRPYATESDLQSFLERHPLLIPGDQVDSANPRRWVLVKREQAVPDSAESVGRWSLDHLLLDQDGILTLVEVKRASDTRARREVVAQMLDYAANAVSYWPIETIINSFRSTWGDLADATLERFLAMGQGEPNVEQYWDRVRTNLEAERIRLVFVADEIPRELQRIVEFLNGQMRSAEVIAVEIRQYVGEGALRTLVPRVVGQTVKALVKRAVASADGDERKWDEESFFGSAEAASPEIAAGARRLVEWFRSNARGVWWSKRAKVGTFTTRALIAGKDRETMRVFADGYAHIAVPAPRLHAELREKLTAALGSPPDGAKYFAIPLSLLPSDDVWARLVPVIRWHIDVLTKWFAQAEPDAIQA